MPVGTPAGVPGGSAPVKLSETSGRVELFFGSLWYLRLEIFASVENVGVQSANHWPTAVSMVLFWVYQSELSDSAVVGVGKKFGKIGSACSVLV